MNRTVKAGLDCGTVDVLRQELPVLFIRARGRKSVEQSAQVPVWLQAICLRRLYQAVDDCRCVRTVGRAREEPVLAPDDERSDRVLCDVVVDPEYSAVGVSLESRPLVQGVGNGLS